MKYTIIVLFLTVVSVALVQADLNLGGGYFAHVLSHPGFLVEAEVESTGSTGVSLLARAGLGAYVQPRYHAGMLIDASTGMRREFDSGLFIEETIGFGVLLSALNSEGVYTVADDGTVSEAGRMNPIDLTASAGIGIGFRFPTKSGASLLVWARPKIFWQFPHKHTSTFNPILQVGVSRSVTR